MSGDEDPVAWLRGQIEARMAAARLAAREGGTWAQDDPARYPGSISSLGGPVVYDEGSPDEYQAAHIALNDPADVIARCEAELAILEYCEGALRYLASGPLASLARRAITALLGAYKHQPGFKAEWLP